MYQARLPEATPPYGRSHGRSVPTPLDFLQEVICQQVIRISRTFHELVPSWSESLVEFVEATLEGLLREGYTLLETIAPVVRGVCRGLAQVGRELNTVISGVSRSLVELAHRGRGEWNELLMILMDVTTDIAEEHGENPAHAARSVARGIAEAGLRMGVFGDGTD